MTLLRQAHLDDLAAIMLLERASFPADAWSERAMRDELASAHTHYVVLEDAGGLVGYAGLRAVGGAADGDVQTIAVAEASRGRGWGRMLLRALIDEAGRRNVRDLFLDVRADNPVAQALYASEGFAEIGRRPRYYQPDDVDAIVMRAHLADRGASAAGTTSRTPSQSAIRRENPRESGDDAPIDGVPHAAESKGAGR